MKRYFIITIDTEGDNLWERATTNGGCREITTKNAQFIPRFQNICNKYGFIPTYLIDHEMANSEVFRKYAKEWANEGKCEIGMHMHAWNCPPIYNLHVGKRSHNPFASEYPEGILNEKIKYLTDEINTLFGINPLSHRGGRWYIDDSYADVLYEMGYIVDCSITPGINWWSTMGNKKRGPDYSKEKMEVTYIGNKHRLLEVPPTIVRNSIGSIISCIHREPFRYDEIISERRWLRPTGSNIDDMISIVKSFKHCSTDYLEFMIHSSELMPGGSPYYTTEGSIDQLYSDIDSLFAYISKSYSGVSLSEYAKSKVVK